MENQKRTKRMGKEERRKQILDTAIKVFVEKGYKASTTLEIAKKANISEVTLFRYFSSKQEIFLEGVKPILLGTLEDSIDVSNHFNSKEKLEYILYERIRFISEHYKIVKLILMEAPLLEELGKENFMEKILKILRSLIQEIKVPKEKEEFTLRLLMGSILSFLFMPSEGEKSMKKYVGEITSTILNQSKDVKGGDTE